VPLAAVSHYSGVELHGGPEYAGVWYGPALVAVFTRSGILSWRSVDGFNASGSGALDRAADDRIRLNENQRITPAAPEPGHTDPEQPVPLPGRTPRAVSLYACSAKRRTRQRP